MQTIQIMNNTMADKKVYHMHICDKACLLCGFHTKTTNLSGQPMHFYCMNQYAEWSKNHYEENKDKCSMCGKKRKFVQGVNVCNECLNASF